MIKITKKKIENEIGHFTFEILNDEYSGKTYNISLDLSEKYGDIIQTDSPKEMSLYRSQVACAIDQYFGKDIPDIFYSETH